ncbi:MAG: DUF4350 domain-containing protein [Candidatus Limnocylindria bacterium]
MGALRHVNVLYVFAALLFAGTVAFSVITAGQTDPTGLGRSASVYDEGPAGTAVLRRWLDGLGVPTTVIQGDLFQPRFEEAHAVLLLGATELLTPADARDLREVVARGGTLVVATEAGLAEGLLLDAFGLSLGGFVPLGEHEAVAPLGALTGARTLSIDQGREVVAERGMVTARAGAAPLAVSVREGAGTVHLVGSLAPFLSGRIGEGDNGRFVLALLDDAIRAGGTVAFDEYHHGAHPPADVLAVVQRTWPGRALVAAGAIVFAFVVLTGRRLGPPLPLEHRPARSSLDHVRAFAGLVRRSGHSEIARDRIRRELRQGIARELGLDPAAPAERLFSAFAAAHPERASEARAIDEQLARPLRDADLLRSVARIDRVLRPDRGAA